MCPFSQDRLEWLYYEITATQRFRRSHDTVYGEWQLLIIGIFAFKRKAVLSPAHRDVLLLVVSLMEPLEYSSS